MSGRSYDHSCGLAFALDAIGERWALLVVRELLCGPRRFSDLMAGMSGVATNTLTTRLEALERQGLVTRTRLPPPAASAVYGLTDKGRALEPVIVALVRWSKKDVAQARAAKRKLAPMRPAWLALALKAFFVPRRVKGQAEVALTLPLGSLTVRVHDDLVEVRDRTPADRPAATVETTEDEVVAHCTGALSFSQFLEHATVTGDPKVLDRVLSAFRPRLSRTESPTRGRPALRR